jgi:hypothetical protein
VSATKHKWEELWWDRPDKSVVSAKWYGNHDHKQYKIQEVEKNVMIEKHLKKKLFRNTEMKTGFKNDQKMKWIRGGCDLFLSCWIK